MEMKLKVTLRINLAPINLGNMKMNKRGRRSERRGGEGEEREGEGG